MTTRSPQLTVLVDEGMLPFAYDEPELPLPERPRVRGDCVGGPRPCPWISCRHHLARVDEGRLMTTVLDLPLLTGTVPGSADEAAWVDDVAEALTGMSTPSCALDVAEQNNCDGETLEAIGNALGVTRENIRQIQVRALTAMMLARRSDRLR